MENKYGPQTGHAIIKKNIVYVITYQVTYLKIPNQHLLHSLPLTSYINQGLIHLERISPAGICLLKVNNRNTRTEVGNMFKVKDKS